MIELYEGGAYLIHGTNLIKDHANIAEEIKQKYGIELAAKEELTQNTIAYGILKAHNTCNNMEALKLKFDAIASHDITYVGIIQTASASGL